MRTLLLRLVWARLTPAEQALAWSVWRRAHQAAARAAHYRSRGATDRIDALHAAIDQLPDHLKTLVRMFYLDEMTCKEVAQAVGLTEKSVFMRLHRTRKKLRTWLAPGFQMVNG